MDDLAKQQALSAVRTLLAIVGGALVTKGMLDEATMQAAVGAIVALIPLVWGVVSRIAAERKAQEREAVAVSAGIAQATGREAPPVTVGQAQTIIATKGPTP